MDNVFRPAPGVVASSDSHGAVLFHTHAGLLFGLNRLGRDIWRGIEQQRPFAAVVADLCREVPASDDVVWRHATQFIDALRQNRLIESVTGGD